MRHIDPSYLRDIYDRLKSRSIKKDDFQSLPFGLAGIFHDILFQENESVKRKRLVDFFAIWAILKTESSISFVSKILGWNEEEVSKLLERYSKWFYCVSQNNFKLIHENLSAYILQNITIQKYKLFIEVIGSKKDEDVKKYSSIYLNDHHYTLAYIDDVYANICLKYNQNLSIDSLPRSYLEQHHHRSFYQASQLMNHKNDFKGLSKLFTSYDNLNNSKFLIEREYSNFIKYKIDYLIDRGNSFRNSNLSLVYWVYFIDYLLSIEIIDNHFHEIEELLKHINKYLIEHNEIKGSILTTKYIKHLNTRLIHLGISELHYINSFEGIPRIMTEYGHEFELCEFITKCFIDKKINLETYVDKITQCVKQIQTFEINDTEAVRLSKKIIVFILEEKFDFLESILMKIKMDVLRNSEKSYDDLYEFDEFIYEIFLSSIHLKPSHDYSNWINYFITAKEFYRLNLSFFIMLKKISSYGQITQHYRNYYFPITKSANCESYIIDEMTTIMYVLGEKNRFDDIKILIGEFLSHIQKCSVYDYYVDLLASSYFDPNPQNETIESIYDHFSKHINKGSASVYQLSYVLSPRIGFLDLISVQLYNANEQSEISTNFQWSIEIIESVYLKLNKTYFSDYVLLGFEKYISVMGSYSLDAHLLDLDLPETNVWKIEWWIMTNVYSAIQLSLKIPSDIKQKIHKNVEEIFKKYSFDSSINLDLGVDRYKEYRKIQDRQDKHNFEYLLHENEKHYLRNFASIQYDNITINKVAGSIKNNTILSLF